MEQSELNEQTASEPRAVIASNAIAGPPNRNGEATARASVSPAACPTCSTAREPNGGGLTMPSYVFAIGRVEMRFPTLGVEKEFAQATSRANTKGLTDQAARHAVLSVPENRYIVRKLCWVFTIQGLETYILIPRDPADYDQLLEAVGQDDNDLAIDVVVGMRGPIAPPEMCNGLMVPIVFFDQIYSFDRKTLINAIPPRKGDKSTGQDKKAAEEALNRIRLLADNAGSTDEHRALNYLAVRYPEVYHIVSKAFEDESSLTAVDVQPCPLSGTRNVVDVIFSFTNRKTDVVDKHFTRVDVSEEFPFLVTKMSPYFDR